MTEKEAKKIVKARNKKIALNNIKDLRNTLLCNILVGAIALPIALLCTAIVLWPLIVKIVFTLTVSVSPIWVNIAIIVWFSLIILGLLIAYLVYKINSKHLEFLKQVREEIELDTKRQQLMPKIIQRLIYDGYDVTSSDYSLIKTWSCSYFPGHPVMCLIRNNNTKEEFEHWLYHLEKDLAKSMIKIPEAPHKRDKLTLDQIKQFDASLDKSIFNKTDK